MLRVCNEALFEEGRESDGIPGPVAGPSAATAVERLADLEELRSGDPGLLIAHLRRREVEPHVRHEQPALRADGGVFLPGCIHLRLVATLECLATAKAGVVALVVGEGVTAHGFK